MFRLALYWVTRVWARVYLLYEAGQGYAEGVRRSSLKHSLLLDSELCFLAVEVVVAPTREQSPAVGGAFTHGP